MSPQHDVYELPAKTGAGYGCRRCSLWSRFLEAFNWLSCPPPDGK